MTTTDPPEAGFISLAEAHSYLPTLGSTSAIRLWLWRRRDTIRHKYGRVCLADLLEQLSKEGNR